MSTYLPTQSYHISSFNAINENTQDDIVGTPGDYITDWEVDSWLPFWNEFDGVNSTLMFNSKEGMLYGGVTISCERRAGREYQTGNGIGATYTIGQDALYKIGIFVNGILVADSGSMAIGGYTLDIPFAIPIGTEYCEVEVKWKADQMLFNGKLIKTTVVLDYFKYFVCSGMHMFARNQYR
jgi:hypothetical protein